MNKLQIAVDYLIVFVFVLFIFVLVFSSLANQRVLVSNQQVFAQLQYVSQLVASQLSSAYQAGNGYNATVQLPSPLSSIGYNITITRQGMVVVTTNVIGQQIQATSFSLAQSIVSNSNYLNPSKLYYTIPTEQSTGFITFQNSFGTICVDYMCPSTSQQSKSLVVYDQVASALNLNGQNVFASSTSPSTSSSTQSVSFWMRPSTPASVGYLIDQGVGGSPNNFVYLSGGNLYAGVSSAACHSELSLSPNVWYFVTYAVGSSTLNLYVNGSLGSGCTASVSPAAPLSVNLGQEAGGSNRFSGELANVQLYSTQLSQLQAQQLYQEGISGQPLQGAGLSGWWPLSSDGTDHSGKGNNLQVSGTAQYQNVVQVFGKVQNFTGVLLQFVPVGFESSLGSFESQQAAQSYTNNGIAYQFLNPGQAGGNANVKVVAFNGNLSTTSNLVAWWPLAEGQGSVAYDLGPSSESASPLNGKLIDSWWSSPNYVMQFSNANILMAKSIVPGSGLSQFTESAWIYFNTIPAQAEIAGEGSSNCGAASIYCFGYYGGSLKLGLAGCGTASTGTSFTPALHTWYFVAGSISGSGTGTIYVNGKQYASLNPVDACVNSAPFQIGSDGNTDFFPGKIANVQLYSTLLNAQQIQAMYNEGIGGAPIITTGLVGWWPLNGDTLDYSGSG
ncbi:MAG: hypothetical protein KGH62_03525, partial [Candidatus Micrarchaeota archaeon]|nr:hypothetical protein [Candidatus Micrarchaeota archaeon]